MAAGNITIDLLMKTGSFSTDTQRAAKSLNQLKRSAQDFATAFKASFAGNLVAGAVQELVAQLARVPGALNDLIKEAGNFQDIGERIGESAENVAGFTLALSASSTEIGTLADFSVRLTKALSKIDDESEGAGKALAALNIPIEQFKALKPADQLDALAKALGGFAAGPEQTAVLEALVKGGSQLLPFLKELQAQGGRQNTLTAEQIRLADDFADRQGRSTAELKLFIQQALIPSLPAITALTEGLKEVIKAMSGLGDAANGLKGSNPIAEFAQDIVIGAAIAIEALIGITKAIALVPSAFGAAIADLKVANAGAKVFFNVGLFGSSDELKTALADRNKTVADFNQRLVDLWTSDGTRISSAVRKAVDSQRRGLSGDRLDASTDPRSTTFGQPLKPRIDISGLATDSASKDDPTKKLLENQLRALDAVVQREQRLLADRNRFLNLYNDQNLLSIQAYYDAQQAIIDAATSSQVEAYDKQVAALQAARKAATKQTDVADLTGKIDETIEKRTRVEQEAGAKGLELAFKRAEAERKYRDQIDGVRASLLELQGDLEAAAAIRFDLQNADLFKRAFVEGDDAAQSLLKTLRSATIAQAAFGKSAADAQRITEQLANAEDRIAISRQLNASTELQALKQLGEARRAAVVQLEAQVQAQEAIARASGNSKLVQDAERARVELEKLKAVADPLGDKFRSIFVEAGGNAIGDFLSRLKTGKDAIKDFGDSVVQQIDRIIGQSIAEKLFGKGGALDIGGLLGGLFGGDVGSSISGIFGGAGAGAGAGQAANTAALAGSTATITGSTLALTAFTVALEAATAAAGSGAAAGAASGLSDLGSGTLSFFGGGLAGGGDVMPGRDYLVGEHGPERFRPRTAGMIMPNDETSALRANGRAISVSVNVQPGQVTQQTGAQIATQAGRAVSTALARGNA